MWWRWSVDGAARPPFLLLALHLARSPAQLRATDSPCQQQRWCRAPGACPGLPRRRVSPLLASADGSKVASCVAVVAAPAAPGRPAQPPACCCSARRLVAEQQLYARAWWSGLGSVVCCCCWLLAGRARGRKGKTIARPHEGRPCPAPGSAPPPPPLSRLSSAACLARLSPARPARTASSEQAPAVGVLSARPGARPPRRSSSFRRLSQEAGNAPGARSSVASCLLLLRSCSRRRTSCAG